MGFKCPLCNMEGGHAIGCHAPEIAAATIEHARICSELAKAKERLADTEEVLADKRRLTRELDAIINGAGAAKQASLCDLLPQVRQLVQRLAVAEGVNRQYEQLLRENLSDFQSIIEWKKFRDGDRATAPPLYCDVPAAIRKLESFLAHADTGYVAVRRKTLYEALLSVPPGTTDGEKITHHWWWDELRTALEVKFQRMGG